MTPVSAAPSLPPSQFTVCTSRFARLRNIAAFLSSAFCKRAAGKGPRQKLSKSFSTLFDNFRAGQKKSKIVKKRQKVFRQFSRTAKKTSKLVNKRQKGFRHFSTIFARHHFSGPFWGALMPLCPCHRLESRLAIPPTPDRAPNPHFLEKRVSGPKNPHFPSSSHDLEKGVFCQKIPRKLSFPSRGEKGVFGPRNPLFQEMGIRGPVWGGGNPKCRHKNVMKNVTTLVAPSTG